MREENAALQKKLDAPFEGAEELARLRQRAQEIADILNPVEDQAGADALGEEEEEPKVKYSKRDNIATNGIKIGMDDLGRYAVLRGQVVTAPEAEGLTDPAAITHYNHMRYSDVEKELMPVAHRLGLIGDKKKNSAPLNNKYLTVEVMFSRDSLHESLHNQNKRLGNIAALLPVLRKVYESALPVLLQEDRYLYTVYDSSKIDTMAYLLGAFTWNGWTVPVQFEIKHEEKSSRLYVVATIKEDVLMATPKANGPRVAPTSSNVSIEDIIAIVKPTESKILANIPAQFLSEEQKRGKREGLKEKGAYLRDKAQEHKKMIHLPVTMTTERIDDMIRSYGAKFAPDYSNAYMTYVNPADFVALNATNPDVKYSESRVLVASEMRNEKETPFIVFDQKTGRITGHEGRHRMAAFDNAGVKQIAILVIPDTEGKNNRQIIDELHLKGKKGREVTLYNLIPVNEKHRQELIDIYGETPNWFKYSTRDTDTLSDRQLLARAYAGLAKTDGERKALERYPNKKPA